MDLTRPPQVQAWITLDRVQSLMSRRIQGRMADFELTRPQYSVLRLLLEQGPLTAQAISAQMGVTPANLTGPIDRLEAAGLLQRQRDDQDRRCVYLSLTQEGRARAEQVVPDLRQLVQQLFRALNPQELDALNHALGRLDQALNAEASEPQQVMS
ncbi:MarR family transcriptional regulator [Deinococcus sonorensis]|uniref:MarR family transcriptional regulator n=2 Tax=Deinococcus sonorensis TaxID=309891 RepID=A0AAU7UCY1_9DEIO